MTNIPDTLYAHLPRSKAEAKALGEPLFFTGILCGGRHLAPRRTWGGRCLHCLDAKKALKEAQIEEALERAQKRLQREQKAKDEAEHREALKAQQRAARAAAKALKEKEAKALKARLTREAKKAAAARAEGTSAAATPAAVPQGHEPPSWGTAASADVPPWE